MTHSQELHFQKAIGCEAGIPFDYFSEWRGSYGKNGFLNVIDPNFKKTICINHLLKIYHSWYLIYV